MKMKMTKKMKSNQAMLKKILQRSRYRVKKKKKAKKVDISVLDGVLSGKTIVVTGVLPIDRKNLDDILKSLGAKVTGSVSKKTDYLVYGESLEDGRSVIEGNKYKKAQTLGTKLLNFNELEDLLKEKLQNNEFNLSTATLENLTPNVNTSNDNTKKELKSYWATEPVNEKKSIT